MSTLSSASTDAQVKAAIDDNASYEEDASVSKAKAYVTAVRIWIRRLAERAKIDRDQKKIEADIEAFKSELETAREWLADNDEGEDFETQRSYADMSNLRD
jgi:hypothetical protein